MAALPTGTVTSLFTDIEGSTTLLQSKQTRSCAVMNKTCGSIGWRLCEIPYGPRG